MAYKSINYRPPETDSEEEYDGFYFGDSIEKTRFHYTTEESKYDLMYNALIAGDLQAFKQYVKETDFNIDEYINDSFTALIYSCKYGHLNIVEYLLRDLRASPNKHYDSYTPLICVFDEHKSGQRKEPYLVEKLVRLLLKHGADLNIADKYGTTPFILACKYGYTEVVKLMIKNVSVNIFDNIGCTPIFYAVENNHPEIVKLLIAAGADTTIPNCKGYTPKQAAQFHGFYDLLELLPKEVETFTVPPTFLTYNTLRDLIPRLFLKSECPEYFQEIYAILLSMKLEKLLQYFAKHQISLQDFLCMNDAGLEKIGITYPIHRIKIQKGLLDFHLHHWKTISVGKVNKSTKENFYEILMVTANHMQNLIILKSSLRYIKANLVSNKLGDISVEQLQQLETVLNNYQQGLQELRMTSKYLSSFSPLQNPLYIDYEEICKERKRRKLKRFFKYTTVIIGISVFICFKIRIL